MDIAINKVTPLKLVPQGTKQPHEQIVASLEDLLASAKRGELRSLAVTAFLDDGRCLDGWYLDPDCPDPYRMSGALHQLMKDFDDLAFENFRDGR